MTRRTISFGVIFMMLWSFVAPVSAAAGHCAGSEAVLEAIAAAESDGHDCGGHGAPVENPAEQQVVETEVKEPPAPSPENQYSFCCTHAASSVRGELDVPTLTVPVISWTVVLPATLYTTFVSTLVDQAAPLASAYKIGSSPPFHAVADQHTYQRTCLLLI